MYGPGRPFWTRPEPSRSESLTCNDTANSSKIEKAQWPSQRILGEYTHPEKCVFSGRIHSDGHKIDGSGAKTDNLFLNMQL